MWRRDGADSEAGVTLIEILLTVSILGICIAGVLGVMGTAIIGSDAHRRMADSETVVRSFSEAAQLAAVRPVSTTLASPGIAAHNSGDTVTVTVTAVAGFTAKVNSHLQIDDESFVVTAVNSATSFKAVANGSSVHAVGRPVTQYLPCPAAADLQPVGFVPPANFAMPVITSVKYWMPTDTLQKSGKWVGASGCADAPCNGDGSTACDSGLVLASISVTSTDTDTSKLAQATALFEIKRPNL